MNSSIDTPVKNTIRILIAAILALGASAAMFAQVAAKTLDTTQVVESDGSITLTFQFAFDAEAWARWKSVVGDDPARLRGMLRHQFAAYVIDDFKFEKDDLNRTARMIVRSPAGPELRKDLRLQIPVEPWCRLISHTDREWFFSGNNPAAGNQQNTVKITLPANAVEASLVNAGTSDQALIYTLAVAPGPSRAFMIAGAVLLGAGVVLVAVGLLLRRKEVEDHSHAASPPPVSNIA